MIPRFESLAADTRSPGTIGYQSGRCNFQLQNILQVLSLQSFCFRRRSLFIMMSTLSVTSLALLIGAIGQEVLYGLLFPRIPFWIISFGTLVPWLTVFAISFCNLPPFGPRPFRNCLIFAMCWYGVTTLLAEVLHLFIHRAPSGHSSTTIARVLMYLGTFSFIELVRACIALSRVQQEDSPRRN